MSDFIEVDERLMKSGMSGYLCGHSMLTGRGLSVACWSPKLCEQSGCVVAVSDNRESLTAELAERAAMWNMV